MSDYQLRFGGIARLYGEQGADIIQAAHFCVVGIGGVGSWAAEALARTGVGKITLIDLDDICTTNVNRQLHALTTTVGMSKVEVKGKPDHKIEKVSRGKKREEYFYGRYKNRLGKYSYKFRVVLINGKVDGWNDIKN